MKLYDDDPSLANASIERKSVHALIYEHKLHDVIEKTGGYLPSIKANGSKNEDIKDLYEQLFTIVQQEIELGRTRGQVVEKLILCGAEESQANKIYDFIYNARKKKS